VKNDLLSEVVFLFSIKRFQQKSAEIPGAKYGKVPPAGGTALI
jgi:hypothetical protein